jgi:hypothetical protein
MPRWSVPTGLAVPGPRQPQAGTPDSEAPESQPAAHPAANGQPAAHPASNGQPAAHPASNGQSAANGHSAVNGQPATVDGSSWPGAAPPAGWFLHAPGQPRAGGPASDPGFQPARTGAPDTQGAQRIPDPAGQDAGELSPWQKSHQLWTEAGIQWEQRTQPPSVPRHAVSPQIGPDPRVAEPAAAGWAGPTQMPLGAPVFSDPDTDEDDAPDFHEDDGPGIDEDDGPDVDDPAGEDQWSDDRWSDDRPPIWERPRGLVPSPALDDTHWVPQSDTPGSRRSGPGSPGRRAARIAVPAIVVVAVAVLAVGLLTGHGPRFGPLTANQHRTPNAAAPRLALGAVNFDTYPGQQQRGVLQAINRVVAVGGTMVAMGSQASDGVVRQQFLVSTDGGASWQLAPLRAPGGGQAALGHPAALLAGGPGGWVAVGPQAIWTSTTGLTWTLAASHGISPQLPGDSVWVITKTAGGFLAAGAGAGAGARTGGSAGKDDGTQAVIWTSRDGVTWQRATAAQLGLAGPGEIVRNISYATWRGNAVLISGTVVRGRTSYDAAWLSTDNGAAWTRVTIPSDHGAGTTISGLGFDGSGLIAVRPGRTASGAADGVAYFSPNGQAWQYSSTIDPAGGWTPGVVKGSDYGFVVSGTSGSGQLVAYTATGSGTAWLPTGPLGDAATESVVGATVAPAGTIVAVGYTTAGPTGQQPVLEEAGANGSVRPIPLDSIAGAAIPEMKINSIAVADGQQIAVGSADGYPAIWRRTGGGAWTLVSSLALAQSLAGTDTHLRALTSVTHGPAGWLAVGAPGPVVLTSADGTDWGVASGGITQDLAGVSAVAVTSGPAGYLIVGKLVAPGGSCVADVWWSPNLTSWTRAHDVNDATGSSQVLSVAASAHGFVSVGSHDGHPAVWTTSDGRSWETIVLPAPDGASTAVLQQVAISGRNVVALGQATTGTGAGASTVPFAELSADGGQDWQQVPFTWPGPGTVFTTLTGDPAGFIAAGLFGPPGQQDVAVWRSATGVSWKPSRSSGLDGSEAWQIDALAPSGSVVAGVGTIIAQQGQQTVTFTLPIR